MSAETIYIVIAIAALLIIAILVVVIGRKDGQRLSPLAGLALASIVAGIVFSDDRFISYSLLGVGVLLAVADMAQQLRGRMG